MSAIKVDIVVIFVTPSSSAADTYRDGGDAPHTAAVLAVQLVDSTRRLSALCWRGRGRPPSRPQSDW